MMENFQRGDFWAGPGAGPPHSAHLGDCSRAGGEEQSSRLIRGDQSSRHTQPRTTATSPSGKSELRGKSGDKKLIWQISGWLVAASGGRGCCWCCRWLISGAHLTVWTQISSDSGVTTVNMSSVQCPSVSSVQHTNNVYPHPHSQLIILHILYSSLTIITLSWYLAALRLNVILYVWGETLDFEYLNHL